MKLFKSIATISLITFFSRILGFIRDFLITKTFGIGESSDAFFVAFKFTNNLRRIFAEGSFSQSFIPILVEYKQKKNKKKNKFFISCVFGFLLFTLILTVLIVCLLSSYIISLITPGFSKNLDKFYLTSLLLKITFPYILLISISSFFSCILNVWNSFIIPAISPIFFNTVVIIFLLFLTKYFYPPILVLSFSVLIGGICQIIYQIPYLRFIDMIDMPRFKINHSGVYKIIIKMIPAFIGLTISQISIIINNVLCSFLIPGSISWIYYADRLIELPSGVLGVAINTILLPKLSKKALKNKNSYLELIDWSLRLGLLFALPSTAILSILAEPFIITLFKYNKFSYFDIYMTKQAVIFYSIGITGIFLMKILATGFYAKQDIKTPIIVSIICLVFNQFLNIFLINIFNHASLALTTSISISLNAIILYYIMVKKNIYSPQPGWKKFLISLLIAATFMSIILFFIKKKVLWDNIDNIFHRLLFLFFTCLIGMIFYFFALNLLKIKIIKFLKKYN